MQNKTIFEDLNKLLLYWRFEQVQGYYTSISIISIMNLILMNKNSLWLL